jgi:prepilin-type N-terminal cleavage/methylation domain-containing protein
MAKSDHTKGFTIIEVILVVAVILIIVLIVVFALKEHHKTNNTPKTTTNSNSKTVTTNKTKTTSKPSTSSSSANVASNPASWTTVTNTTYGMTFRYPSSWYLLPLNSAGEPGSGTDPQAVEYDLYAQAPTDGINNDACVKIYNASDTDTSINSADFDNGTVLSSVGNNFQLWQNDESDGDPATTYLISPGQQYAQLQSGTTLIIFASLDCSEGMNVTESYSQQIADPNYQTAIKVLSTIGFSY